MKEITICVEPISPNDLNENDIYTTDDLPLDICHWGGITFVSRGADKTAPLLELLPREVYRITLKEVEDEVEAN